MKPIQLLALLCACAAAPLGAQTLAATATAATPWELEKDKSGIQAYTRQVEGQVLKEFKITTEIEAAFDNVAQLLADPYGYGTWLGKTFYDWQVLEKRDDNAYLIYYSANMPLFTTDRDCILSMEFSRNGRTFISKMTALPHHLPPAEGRIRIPRTEAVWIARELSPTRVEVAYMGAADPGGNIPVNLVNKAMVAAPIETVENLREEVRRRAGR